MDNKYTGYITVKLTDEQLSDFYQDSSFLLTTVVENQYLFIKDKTDQVIDKYVRRDNKLVRLNYSFISNTYSNEKVKPMNDAQEAAIDLLKNDQVTVKLLRGVYGSGKDYLMLSYALEAIEKGKYEKIIFIRPNVTVKDLPNIGYLPGEATDKLSWTLGPLYDKVGGIDGVNYLTENHKLEMMPLLFIRGRSFENSIIYVTEGQNITTEIAKLLLGRVGKNSILIINGDTHQTDNKVYDSDNGIITLIDKLKGNKLFGYVYLDETLRSETANLANLLD